jgi:hypothetical protein
MPGNPHGCTDGTTGTTGTTKKHAELQSTAEVRSKTWRLRLPGGELIVGFSRALDRSEVVARYPNAISAEPAALEAKKPDDPMTIEQTASVLAWLAAIEETDATVIADVLELCQRDAEARGYFLARAAGQFMAH